MAAQLKAWRPLCGTQVNSADPDQNAASDQCILCLPT